MAKETHIKTDKKTVGGWRAWELQFYSMKTIVNFPKITKNGVVQRSLIR
jgi:hypothetical protein